MCVRPPLGACFRVRTHPPPPESITLPHPTDRGGGLTGHNNPPPRSKDRNLCKSCAIPADIHQTTRPCASQINFNNLSGLILRVGPCRLKSSPLSVSPHLRKTLQRTPCVVLPARSNPIRHGRETTRPTTTTRRRMTSDTRATRSGYVFVRTSTSQLAPRKRACFAMRCLGRVPTTRYRGGER